ncbi:MAG: penicillin acylase family protein [Solirubrobacteraceae bacterium]|nr:penicillin acylase family protein [Solirubrobacteraceae bacterium]
MRVGTTFAVLFGVAALAAPAVSQAAPPPDRATTAFSVLPPGNGDVWGPTSRHKADQVRLYDGLETAAAQGWLGQPGSAAPSYKRATLEPEQVAREERPRGDVTIRWDAMGVPFIHGSTVGAASFGAGWAMAEGRYSLMEALRRLGRAGFVQSFQAEGLPGGGARPQLNYSDDELQEGIDELYAKAGDDEQDIQAGIDGYVAGVNAWLAVNRTKIPWNIQLPFGQGRLADPQPWRPVDVAASAVVINDVFGVGGGGELGAAKALRSLRGQLGDDEGLALYEDLRQPDPTATFHDQEENRYPKFAAKEGDVPTGDPGPLDPKALAMPDASTPVTAADEPRKPSMSNWAVLGGSRTSTGHPLLIGGPQMGYFSPEIVMEMAFSTDDFTGRGIAVPGLGPILIAGRTAEYAWSPTSGGTDATDVRAELLCEPDGTAPTRESRHYVFQGECRAMTKREGAPANTAWRTVHGPVMTWGSVDGRPVGFAHERKDPMSTPVSALGFYRMMTGRTKTAESFVDAARDITLSLNIGYVNATQIAYAHTGRYPVRAPGTRSDLPTWGTGAWEWRGTLDPKEQPAEIQPASDLLLSWNNIPAPGWTGEGWWGGNVRHRVDALADRYEAAPTMTPDQAIKAHQDAATEDVEAVALVRALERLLGDQPAPTPAAGRAWSMLRGWLVEGAHRRDANRDWFVDAPAGTLVEPLTDALLERTYGTLLGDEALRATPVHENRPGPTGSAYQSGWFSPLARELDRASGHAAKPAGVPAACGGGDAAACRATAWAALDAAYGRAQRSQFPWVRNSPTRWRAQAAGILFIPVVTLPSPMRWQNRPTFEQVSAFAP